jgi:hypothetical protein
MAKSANGTREKTVGGAVFLLNAGNLDDAKSILESLPLAHENLMDHEYIPVGPLMPLRLLLGSAPAKP